MGWWSESIMGGDTPLDFQGNFEELFGDPEMETDTDAEYRVPSADEGVKFINDNLGIWGGGIDDHVLKQVTGFLMIERGAAMSDELRALVLEGIDGEIADGCEEWNEPKARIKELQGFRKIVEAYPAEGAHVEMPHQPGLFAEIERRILAAIETR